MTLAEYIAGLIAAIGVAVATFSVVLGSDIGPHAAAVAFVAGIAAMVIAARSTENHRSRKWPRR
jgi:peptidoglycan/LPS O-acetylase OafA/YrhL